MEMDRPHVEERHTDITREALEWNPQGKRKRGRPKITWRRTVLEEAKSLTKLVAALCSEGNGKG